MVHLLWEIDILFGRAVTPSELIMNDGNDKFAAQRGGVQILVNTVDCAHLMETFVLKEVPQEKNIVAQAGAASPYPVSATGEADRSVR
ncbi:hypothetical protein, conserved [Leishmania tarentolae]|uniref:Uncharacterized protein n=1 Tax=Leishmania tarentolae TaxID=5689 RepID=A0A640KJV2_LEITA|nr:hypothetical protein, conserved [Leishmania tarentolae]